MEIKESQSSGCFPRLGFRENVEATPFYVCPEDGAVVHSMVRLVGNKDAMIQLNNVDMEEVTANVLFKSKYYPHVELFA